MRTFVALNLPPDERVRMHAALAPLRARDLPIRWLEPESFHLTLIFLGDTTSDHVAAIRMVLRRAAARRSPIRLRLQSVGAFPSLRRADIIWVGIAQDPELSALHRELEPELSRLGFPRDQRPFRPHVTVGRAQRTARSSDISPYTRLVRYEADVIVDTVDLMQSLPTPQGSRYEPLLECRIGSTEEYE